MIRPSGQEMLQVRGGFNYKIKIIISSTIGTLLEGDDERPVGVYYVQFYVIHVDERRDAGRLVVLTTYIKSYLCVLSSDLCVLSRNLRILRSTYNTRKLLPLCIMFVASRRIFNAFIKEYIRPNCPLPPEGHSF